MPLDELLKMYGQNTSVNHNIPHSHDDVGLFSKKNLVLNSVTFQTNTSSDDDEEENNRPPQLHHLLRINGQLLPDNDNDDDDDTDDSFEPEIIKVRAVFAF